MAVVVRSPIAADAPRLAEAWLEFGRYYVSLDPAMFRIPENEGLEGWIRTAILGPPDEDRLWLVAEVDDAVQGYVQAEISRPGPDARWELLADLQESAQQCRAEGGSLEIGDIRGVGDQGKRAGPTVGDYSRVLLQESALLTDVYVSY